MVIVGPLNHQFDIFSLEGFEFPLNYKFDIFSLKGFESPSRLQVNCSREELQL